jgi:hypothetical protein
VCNLKNFYSEITKELLQQFRYYICKCGRILHRKQKHLIQETTTISLIQICSIEFRGSRRHWHWHLLSLTVLTIYRVGHGYLILLSGFCLYLHSFTLYIQYFLTLSISIYTLYLNPCADEQNSIRIRKVFIRIREPRPISASADRIAFNVISISTTIIK